jgi:hypothetical protein
METNRLTYQPSKYWDKLSKRADDMLSNFGYENFKRTIGLFLYNDYFYDYGKGALANDYDEKVCEVWDKLYAMCPPEFLNLLSEPLEGNPLSATYRGREVSMDLAASVAEYFMMYQYINMFNVKTIHEIGGGYGRLAYVIKTVQPNITYRMYDIEPSLSLAQRYLNSVLPNSGIEFHTPDKLTEPCNILIAMDCIHEMTREQVENYFEYADKKADHFYYTCWKNTTVPHDEITWTQDNYPVRENWKPLYFGQHRMRVEFFEALYKCR